MIGGMILRIMHILASHMRIEGGMPIAICNLMDAQIENGDESVLLSLSAKVSEIENDNIIFANNIHIFLKSLRDFNLTSSFFMVFITGNIL